MFFIVFSWQGRYFNHVKKNPVAKIGTVIACENARKVIC